MKKHTTDQIIRKLREAEVLASQGKDTAIASPQPRTSALVHRYSVFSATEKTPAHMARWLCVDTTEAATIVER